MCTTIITTCIVSFLSTLSLRRATAYTMTTTICIVSFLSTLSLRRATSKKYFSALYCKISIHALLAESDIRNAEAVSKYMIFLSTLSLRRATSQSSAKSTPEGAFLSTLSLRRATRYVSHMGSFAKISIHALLAESDHRR